MPLAPVAPAPPALTFEPASDLSWQRDALCVDLGLRLQLLGLEVFLPFGLDMFFPDDGRRRVAATAKAICGRCLVADECLRYALDNFIRDGIWGGTTEKERRVLQRDRRDRGVTSRRAPTVAAATR